MRSTAGRRRLIRAELLSIAAALSVALGMTVLTMWGMTSSLREVLTTLLVASIFILAPAFVVGTLVGLSGEVRAVERPSLTVRQAVIAALFPVFGIALCVTLGLRFGYLALNPLISSLEPNSSSNPVFTPTAITVGIVVGALTAPLTGGTWLRYGLGVLAAKRVDVLPKRPARFLDWCLERGLLRMVGANLQFRHRELQEYLVSRP